MRNLSSNLIFTLAGKPLRNGIISVSDSGEVLKIIDTGGELRETERIEFYPGVLVPGFVNAHCHTELSGLKGKVPEGTGLTGFISKIQTLRKNSEPTEKSIRKGIGRMEDEGIVLVGDVCNGKDSFSAKSESTIQWYNFIELFRPAGSTTDSVLAYGEELMRLSEDFGFGTSLVPHAPYSVPPDLFRKIAKAPNKSKIISFHNQESESENSLFTEQKGDIKNLLEKRGFNYSGFNFEQKSSLQTVLKYIRPENHILPVHNTFTSSEDIDFAENYSDNIYWVFCPSANMYIEGRLPDIPLFLRKQTRICLGTDSLASNTDLSVLQEMKKISFAYPQIDFEKLLHAASLNGAKALKQDKQFGSIEPGKKPGINLISNFDFSEKKLSLNSRVKRIV